MPKQTESKKMVKNTKLTPGEKKKIKNDVMVAWQELNSCYELVIEPEVFWRLGDRMKP